MTLVGRTALSVEMRTKCFAPYSGGSSATLRVPSTLFVTASRGVRLHERDVLVRRRVEHRVRGETLEHVLHALTIADVGDHRHASDIRGEADQLVVGVEDGVFAVPEHDDAGGLEAGELAAEFTADRAARPGHQDRLAGGQFAHLRHVGDDRLPPQQVLDLHLPQRGNRNAARQDIEHPRDGARPCARSMRRIDHLAHHLAGRAGHRDDDFLRGEFVDEVRQVLERRRGPAGRASGAHAFRGSSSTNPIGCRPIWGCPSSSFPISSPAAPAPTMITRSLCTWDRALPAARQQPDAQTRQALQKRPRAGRRGKGRRWGRGLEPGRSAGRIRAPARTQASPNDGIPR